MPRPLWSGTISFGLVTIPIGVHTAVRDLGPHFHLLRSSDKSRVKFQKIAVRDSQPVSKTDLVKGFEYEKGRYVVLTPEDFENAALHKDRTIDIIDFVKADQIDDRYFDKPYYLVPGAGGAKAYAVLREALKRSERVGVAIFVMRDKQHLAAVEAIDHALVLTTMRFQDELVEEGALAFPGTTLRDRDLTLADRLIESLAADWDPAKYTNEYRKNLVKVIKAKQTHARPRLRDATEPQTADVVDLMERLRKSLGQAGSSPRRRSASQSSTPRSATARGKGRRKNGRAA